MNLAQSLIQQADAAYLASVAKGQPVLPEGVADKAAYLEGLVMRQNAAKSWTVAEALLSVSTNLYYSLNHMLRFNHNLFDYARAQENLEFLFALESLSLDLSFWHQARKAVAKGCYDCAESDDWAREQQRWHIYQVNEINDGFKRFLDLAKTLQATPPLPVADSPVDILETINEVLPLVQAFADYFPELCAVLDAAGAINLTGRPPENKSDALPQLEFTLPNSTVKAHLPLAQVLGKDADVLKYAKVQTAATLPVEKAASDFQGFVLGIVLEPGDPDNRDLHGNWTSKEDCELACDRWALRYGVVGVGHTEFPEEQGTKHPHFVLLRNWIQIGDAVIGGRLVKDGTWLQAYQAVSEWAKAAVANFEINGLSPGGTARFIPDAA
jgi:hypothetical protein